MVLRNPAPDWVMILGNPWVMFVRNSPFGWVMILRNDIRTTNVVERSFKEVKRKVKGIGRFQNEERALTMVYWQLKELKKQRQSSLKSAYQGFRGLRHNRNHENR